MTRTAKLRKVRRLIRLVDEGALSDDGANALHELKEIVEGLVKTARDVVDNWESGDLAGAVNDLRVQLEQAEG